MDSRDDRDSELKSRSPSLTDALAAELLDGLTRLAAGDLSVRIQRNFARDTEDTVAYYVNIIAEELGRVLDESERRRNRVESTLNTLNDLFLKMASGDFSVRAPRDESGDSLDVLGFLFNATVEELGRVFRESGRQQSILSGIFDAIHDAIFLLDENATISHANAGAARLLNTSVEDLDGRSFHETLSGGEGKFIRMLSTGTETVPFEARDTLFSYGDAEPVLLSLSGTPLITDGVYQGFVLWGQDQRELRNIQAQLQISDRMATMGTLAAGVAHEVNNPLSFVLSNLEFIAEELEAMEPGQPLSKEMHAEFSKAVATCQSGAERVSGIIQDLKSISRVDESTESNVNLGGVLDTACSMLKNDIRHRARIVRDYTPNLTVLTNEARLIQVALNLIQNAAHAIEVGNAKHNEIRLKTGVDSAGLHYFSVSDTGTGISESDLRRIFESFYTTKDIGVGTGLGLSICKRLISKMGGHIEVSSELGKGSTFTVLLPNREITKPIRKPT
jgi:signal transduction histidine kinase